MVSQSDYAKQIAANVDSISRKRAVRNSGGLNGGDMILMALGLPPVSALKQGGISALLGAVPGIGGTLQTLQTAQSDIQDTIKGKLESFLPEKPDPLSSILSSIGIQPDGSAITPMSPGELIPKQAKSTSSNMLNDFFSMLNNISRRS